MRGLTVMLFFLLSNHPILLIISFPYNPPFIHPSFPSYPPSFKTPNSTCSGAVGTPATSTRSSPRCPWTWRQQTSLSSWTWTRTTSSASPTPTPNMWLLQTNPLDLADGLCREGADSKDKLALKLQLFCVFSKYFRPHGGLSNTSAQRRYHNI